MKNGVPSKNNIDGGLDLKLTVFFLVAQMAGAGFLALPYALVNTGWLGLAMIFLFCGSVGFIATRLGRCWMMLEERWPEYKQVSRQPYIDITTRAFSFKIRKLVLILMTVRLVGSTTVFMILTSEMISSLVPALNQCDWVLVCGVIFIPIVWLGSPKDFWQLSVFAVIATVIACIVITAQIIAEYGAKNSFLPVQHPSPTVGSFGLGFGSILFAFGGCSVLPTIQNDMKDRSQFWKAAVIAFTIILCLYVPVAVTGYMLIGEDVNSNVLLSLPPSVSVTVAKSFEIFNLIGTYVININPVMQSMEQVFNIPPKFCLKRLVLRSSIVVFQIIISLAIPEFSIISNLIGGSVVTLFSFLLPPVMYMRLADHERSPQNPVRYIPLWERIYLWEIFIVGIFGGIAATGAALYALLKPNSFSNSCFVNFDM